MKFLDLWHSFHRRSYDDPSPLPKTGMSVGHGCVRGEPVVNLVLTYKNIGSSQAYSMAVRLNREQAQELARTIELSLHLAESNMQIRRKNGT